MTAAELWAAARGPAATAGRGGAAARPAAAAHARRTAGAPPLPTSSSSPPLGHCWSHQARRGPAASCIGEWYN